MRTVITSMVLIASIALFTSCKGNEQEKPGTQVEQVNKEANVATQEETKPAPPIDHALAEKGEELFKTKGCIACHSIGEGRRTGPDLAGVTERRKLDWIENMILDPDKMLEKDPIARELLATYMVKMTNQNVKPEEAQAIVMYLREKDSQTGEEVEEESEQE
ncbi:MAG: cytochrome c [Deltaproteobacteria bacterium]|nr:cytochrome c [Deltaproteobacteria bacterium]